VIEILKNDPALSRQLPPRRFEDIVGELLEKQGYGITLTPAMRDGGFDIYAAKKDGFPWPCVRQLSTARIETCKM
jgi:restriction system protein